MPRIEPKPYLNMPRVAGGKVPPLLSQTGAFQDVRASVPSRGLIPYDVAVPFWSDGATKLRWISVPHGQIGFAATGEWAFPKGTVFVKTFEMPIAGETVRRLETRLLVCDETGGVYGVVYKWRPDESDADLLEDGLTEALPVGRGSANAQTWYYPSRKDCLACHNAKASGVLGVKTRQINRTYTYAAGVAENQLEAWDHLGLFRPALAHADISKLPQLAAADDLNRSLEDRARSYLDANCSQCHRPGVTVADFDARYDTPADRQGIVSGPVLIDEGIDHPRIIAPRDEWRSVAFMRVDTTGDIRMPPIGRETIDPGGVALLREWINSLPGKPVLPPPTLQPDAGQYSGSVQISLSSSSGDAVIHYTLDGTDPGPKDPVYEAPLTLHEPTVVRARAYQQGFVHSVTSQGLYQVMP